MAKLLILLATHLACLICGGAMVALHTRARRAAATANLRAVETREIFVDHILALRTPSKGLPIVTPRAETSAGRHRAVPQPQPHVLVRAPRTSLLPNATLDETIAFLATAEARRVTEHRAFEHVLTEARRAAAASKLVRSGFSRRAPRIGAGAAYPHLRPTLEMAR